MRRRRITDTLVVHTAAFKGSAGVEEIREWHLKRGWSDIGYHYVIRRDGTLEKGRDTGLSGAHARGFNHRSIGVCFEGHGDHEPPTIAQLVALMHLYGALWQKYKIPLDRVIGHRETGANKTCPGDLVDMNDLRDLLGFVE